MYLLFGRRGNHRTCLLLEYALRLLTEHPKRSDFLTAPFVTRSLSVCEGRWNSLRTGWNSDTDYFQKEP
jgi:hypothetical protein